MKRVACLFLVVICGLCLNGCRLFRYVAQELAYVDVENLQVVVFSADEVLGNADDAVYTPEALQAQTLQFSAYHGNRLYNLLSGNEQVAYFALAFALEQGYPVVGFSQTMQLTASRCEEILTDFSLDSPLVEQNLWYASGTFSTYDASALVPLYQTAVVDGVYIAVENFEAQWWQKKLQAIEKAEQIVARLPADQTAAQDAQWLYRYLVEHTEYYDYGGADIEAVQPFLYHAFFGGKTHCDGLTNALGLLYHLAGIESVEKIYFSDEEDSVGHTWNTFCIDGNWYNADATGSSLMPKARFGVGAGPFFGFADLLQEYLPYKAEAYNLCGENLYMPLAAHLPNLRGDGFLTAVKQAWAQSDGLYAYLLVDEYNAAQLKNQMQKLANQWGGTVHWTTLSAADDRTAILIYNEDLEG